MDNCKTSLKQLNWQGGQKSLGNEHESRGVKAKEKSDYEKRDRVIAQNNVVCFKEENVLKARWEKVSITNRIHSLLLLVSLQKNMITSIYNVRVCTVYYMYTQQWYHYNLHEYCHNHLCYYSFPGKKYFSDLSCYICFVKHAFLWSSAYNNFLSTLRSTRSNL